MRWAAGLAVSAAVIALTALESAQATMPVVTPKPEPPSVASCRAWAAEQSDDAVEMWGIQQDGTSPRAVALSRLADSCLGRPQPDIVGFGSSAGFDEAYCGGHPGIAICAPTAPAASAPADSLTSAPDADGQSATPDAEASETLDLRATVQDQINRTGGFLVTVVNYGAEVQVQAIVVNQRSEQSCRFTTSTSFVDDPLPERTDLQMGDELQWTYYAGLRCGDTIVRLDVETDHGNESFTFRPPTE